MPSTAGTLMKIHVMRYRKLNARQAWYLNSHVTNACLKEAQVTPLAPCIQF